MLDGALLNGAMLDGALLNGAMLDGALLNGAMLDGALLNGAMIMLLAFSNLCCSIMSMACLFMGRPQVFGGAGKCDNFGILRRLCDFM
jgi:uncharacterized protein YjbI with pentapeptide repeats